MQEFNYLRLECLFCPLVVIYKIRDSDSFMLSPTIDG